MFDQLTGHIAGRFTRVEPRRRATALILGLLSDLPRKNCWTLAETAYGFQIVSRQGDLTLLAMTGPLLLLGLGFGAVGGPIADMALAEVPHENAGSASGLFNTAMHLGFALGAALTALVFFSATGGSTDGALNRDAFTGVLWWVGAAFALMWALMFLLPTRTSNQTQ